MVEVSEYINEHTKKPLWEFRVDGKARARIATNFYGGLFRVVLFDVGKLSAEAIVNDFLRGIDNV